MTVAVDIRTGKVIGQVPGPVPDIARRLNILTKHGWMIVPRESIRLEETGN